MSGPASQVNNLIEKRLTGVWTMVPAIVDTVNRSKMVCDIRIKVTREEEQYLQVTNVPVAFPRGGNTCILLPIQSGDVVLVGFSKWSLDQLLVDMEQVVKSDLDADRKFHYRDAIVLLGLATDIEKGKVLLDDAILEIPAGDLIIYDPDVVRIGAVLKLLDLGGNPTVAENGMMWRDGKTIYSKSNDIISSWGSGGGGSSIPRYSQAAEPALPANTEALWWDTVHSQMWFIANRSGTNYKVEMS
jgi:hypothetical protein